VSASNPIVERLDRLHDQWIEFSLLPDARLLRWLIQPDELRMVEAFLAKESDERAAELPDLFLTLPEPFVDVDSYGTSLRAAILAQYEGSRANLVGAASAWHAPAPTPGTHSLAHLVDTCASLRAHFPNMDCLVLVLMPSEVSDYGEWQRWLVGACRGLTASVRLLVVDDANAPALETLALAEPGRVRSVAADLDMPGALTGVARMGGTAGPDGQFRVKFAEMSTAMGAGDLDRARQSATGALAVASENGWLHLVAAVHFAMGAGLSGAGRQGEALASYQQADAAGKRLAGSDEALGHRLRLTAAFGMAAALVGARDFVKALGVYEGSAPMAEKVGDPLLLTECWRMAAYCHEQTADPAKAWERGFMALAAAEGIPAGERAGSTIPFVRDGLIRLAAGSAPHIEAIERRVAELLPGAASGATGGGA
jgi:hypothetical protein